VNFLLPPLGKGRAGVGKKFTAKISNTYLPLRSKLLATLFSSKQKLPSIDNFGLEVAVMTTIF
jgi:hypothetical protein